MKDLAGLPVEIQARVELIVFTEIESENPFALGYVEKMTGHNDKYKIRVGDYRIGISINKQIKTLICQRIAHRREIYRIFP